MADAAAQIYHLVAPLLQEATRVLLQQADLLRTLQPRLQACVKPAVATLASHWAQEQGGARALRTILAHISDAVPRLEVAAGHLASALSLAVSNGAARDALPVLDAGLPHDEIAAQLVALPSVDGGDYSAQDVPNSVHVAHACVRLAIDHYLHRCVWVLRRISLSETPIEDALGYLATAYVLVEVAWVHTFDADLHGRP